MGHHSGGVVVAHQEHGVAVRLLGPFELFVDGVEVSKTVWKSKKALTLFQYLVAQRGVKVPKETILELLWPDEDPNDSNNKLYATVYLLRRAIQPHLEAGETSYVRSAQGMYWVDCSNGYWVDTQQFERLCRESEELEREDPQRALAQCKAALSLYRGDFLPDQPFEDWTISHREQLRELFVELTLRTSSLVMSLQGNASEAVRLCRQALSYDTFREELHQAIIAYLIEAGRYAEAATQYRQLRTMLEEEFGLPPSPETQALIERMRNMAVQPGHDGSTPKAEGDATVSIANAEGGPLLCDRATFDAIMTMLLRQQEREARPFAVLTIMTDGKVPEGETRTIRDSVKSTLRKSDVVCWSEERLLILLNGTGKVGCDVVRRRVVRTFERFGIDVSCEAQVHDGERQTPVSVQR